MPGGAICFNVGAEKENISITRFSLIRKVDSFTEPEFFFSFSAYLNLRFQKMDTSQVTPYTLFVRTNFLRARASIFGKY